MCKTSSLTGKQWAGSRCWCVCGCGVQTVMQLCRVIVPWPVLVDAWGCEVALKSVRTADKVNGVWVHAFVTSKLSWRVTLRF